MDGFILAIDALNIGKAVFNTVMRYLNCLLLTAGEQAESNQYRTTIPNHMMNIRIK